MSSGPKGVATPLRRVIMPGPAHCSREAFEEMQFIAAVQGEQVDREPDELGAGPVVRHVADFPELLAEQRLFFAPDTGRRGMVGEGVKDLRGLASVALPEPGVP